MYAPRTVLALIVLLPWSRAVLAYSGGITTESFGASGCNACHSGGLVPTVTLTGPTQVAPNSTNEYTLQISTPGSQSKGGFNVSAEDGTLAVGGSSATKTGTRIGGGGHLEVTHTSPKTAVRQFVNFSFLWTAPASFSSVTLNAWGNAVNGDGSSFGDKAMAANLIVSSASPLEVATMTPTTTATAVSIATATPTSSSTATPADTPSATPSNSATVTLVNTPTATPSPSQSPTSTSAPSFTVTFAATETATPTSTPVATETPTSTRTPTLMSTPTPTAPENDLRGDANCDGNLGAADLTALVMAIATNAVGICGADADGSGAVDDADLAATITLLYGAAGGAEEPQRSMAESGDEVGAVGTRLEQAPAGGD